MATAQVIGAGGARIAVRSAGPVEAPPLVLVHGWAQSSVVWARQLTSAALAEHFRILAPDLRGHGDSADGGGYRDSQTWAGDLAAVLEHAGQPAVLVGWSYGGLVLADYLRHYGDRGLAGLAFVSAITELGKHPGGRIGPVMKAALPTALSADPAESVPALRRFVADSTACSLPAGTIDDMVDVASAVPSEVRSELFRRDVISADVLAHVGVPTLVVHGEQDRVVEPDAGLFTAETVPGACTHWYPRTGHVPFLEDRERFDAELAAFAAECRDRVSG